MTPRDIYLLHFDGNFTDEVVGNTWVAGAAGAATSATQKKYGSAALRYNASADRVFELEAGANTGGSDAWSTGSWCADGYVYPTATRAPGTGNFNPLIVDVNTATGALVSVQLTDTSTIETIYTSDQSSFQLVDTTVSLSINTWYHIRFSCDGTNTYLFLDGSLIATTAVTPGDTLTGPVSFALIQNLSISTTMDLTYIDECRFVAGDAIATSSFPPLTNPFVPYVPPAVSDFWTNFNRSYEIP